jgi:tetratricopeptide (TPR) repeat protein
MQLDLFNWDRIEIGVGRNSLARLDFPDARHRFNLVLRGFPNHPEAAQSMEELLYWEKTLAEFDALPPETAPPFLWATIRRFPFDAADYSQQLRRSLIQRLLTALADRPTFYAPPDLCSGYLHLQLGDLTAAVTALRSLVQSRPDSGLPHLYLGESLYRQGRTERSGPCYAKALLLDPEAISPEAISHQPLAEVIKEYGPALAPIHAFLHGILPLVADDALPVTPATTIYTALQQAEQARRDGRHHDMITARRELKNLSADIFQEYLDTLEGSTV